MAKRPDNLDLARLSVRIYRDQLDQIEALAEAARTKLSPVVRELLQEALDARALRASSTPSVPPFDASGPYMGGQE